MKTIHEIREAFGRSVAAILNGHHDALAEIAAEREPAERHYLDRLSVDERMRLMREQKTERAWEIRDAAAEAYGAELDHYGEELSGRADHVRGRLFKVEDAGAFSRAALDMDAELGAMLELGATAGNPELGRAVFVASEQGGLGDLMARYFDRVDPEARDLYAEWTEIPPAEVRERQRENVEALLPQPDSDALMPRAHANT